jgi:hypothetical protein
MTERDKIVFTTEQLDELLNKIRANEREACMKLCKEHFYAYQAYQAIQERENT